MAEKLLRAKSYSDYSKGCWQSISEALAPENSVKLNLNLDSDAILGELVTRPGSLLIGSQISAGRPILGLHNYRQSVGSDNRLFAAIEKIAFTIADEFSESGQNTELAVYNGTSRGQSFTGDGNILAKLYPYIHRISSPTGNAYLKVYNHSGVFGTSSVGTGSAIAVSDPIDVTTISTTLGLVQFTFSGANKIVLGAGTKYVFMLEFSGGDVSNRLALGAKTTGGHAGNGVFNIANTWSSSSYDMCFHIYSEIDTNVIYDVVNASESLTGDTFGLKTRFLTYLDSCLRLNGGNAPKAWNGSAWVTTGGAFDLSNMPQNAKFGIEFRDRVYVGGMDDAPDQASFSGIANSVTKQISWTVDNGFIVFEQEDGGGGLTGFAKVPGYLLAFKKRTLKRYDGSSAFPEDMVNQGAPCQEVIVMGKGMASWINENGAWMSTGGDPKKISSYTVDEIIKSCSADDLLNASGGTDEDHFYWSLPSVTMCGETYTNVQIKYNVLQNTWDVRKYPTSQRVFAKYVDPTGKSFLAVGDSDGNVLKLNTGNDDNGSPIFYSLETHDWVFGYRLFIKGISRMGIITEGMTGGTIMWRKTSRPEDWVSLGSLDKEITFFDKIDLRANRYNFKIFGETNSGRVRIKSIEFPAGIKVFDSV